MNILSDGQIQRHQTVHGHGSRTNVDQEHVDATMSIAHGFRAVHSIRFHDDSDDRGDLSNHRILDHQNFTIIHEVSTGGIASEAAQGIREFFDRFRFEYALLLLFALAQVSDQQGEEFIND